MNRSVKWDCLLWGVKFKGSLRDDRPMLLGRHWHAFVIDPYPGEPSRTLTFTTRRAAADWCRRKLAEYSGRGDCFAQWRFRPVRVREVTAEIVSTKRAQGVRRV